jgi:hypothetical protein
MEALEDLAGRLEHGRRLSKAQQAFITSITSGGGNLSMTVSESLLVSDFDNLRSILVVVLRVEMRGRSGRTGDVNAAGARISNGLTRRTGKHLLVSRESRAIAA